MAPRLSGQTSIFGVVFLVSKSLLGIEGQRKLEKFAILTRKPQSHAGILIYRTWPIRDTKQECAYSTKMLTMNTYNTDIIRVIYDVIYSLQSLQQLLLLVT